MAGKMYQIRRKSDGLYSSGGSYPIFKKIGKTWTGPGPLKLHVGMVIYNFKRQQERYPYNDCEIVTLLVQEDQAACIPVGDYNTLQK